MFGKPKIPENLTMEEYEAAEPVFEEWEREKTIREKNFLRVGHKIVNILGAAFIGQAMLTGATVPLSKAEKPKIESKTAKDLEKKVGPYAVMSAMQKRGTYKEMPRAIPNITGWEKLGIPNEAVDQIVRETLPRGWHDTNLGEISLAAEEKLQITKEYNIPGDALAICYPDGRLGGRHKIKFGQAATKDHTPEQLLSVALSHELAHAHDFRFALIAPEKRLELFSKIIERLSAKNKFRSDYVEKINNSDKQIELVDKAIEYFAVIVSEYLSEPMAAKYRMPKEDVEIVEKFLADIDSDFKPAEAAAKRRKLIGNFVRGEMVKKLPKDLESLGPEKTKTYLEFVSSGAVDFQILSAENFDRADFFNKELKQKLKKMPKEYTFLYRMWRASKRALIDGRANYQSSIPNDVAGRGLAWGSHNRVFDILLTEFDGKKREQAKAFFEELDGLFDDFSDIGMLLKLDRPQK